MNEIALTYCSINIINILILILLAFLIKDNDIMSSKKSSSYLNVIFLTIVVIVAEICTNIFEIMPDNFEIASIISNIIGFSISLFIPVSISALYCSKIRKIHNILNIPNIIMTVLIVTTPFTGWIFSITPDNKYSRGPLFFLYIVCYIYGFILILISNILIGKKYIKSDKLLIGFLYALLISGTLIQIIFPYIHSTWHCVTLTLIIYYIFQRELFFRYDALTGLLNRQAYENQLKKAYSFKSGVVFLFDLDKLKIINDLSGHTNGDLYLREAASVIKQAFESTGRCYRIGGDEFCVISKIDNQKQIDQIVQYFEQCLTKMKNKSASFKDISYGFCVFNNSGEINIYQAIREADNMTYENKFKKYGK